MTVLSTMTPEEMIARIQALETQNAKLAAAHTGKLSCKVTEKGGVSVYGLGRFPVTLYASQWDRLLQAADQVQAFIGANRAKLAVKGM